MTKPVPPWEPGTRETTFKPNGKRRHAPASEAHKRGLALDWLATTPDARPALLRRIVGAEYNSRYTGRTAILDEVADAAYEMATDKDDLDGLMQTIAADLQARKEGAALLNKETPPGVVAGIIARRVRLAKTEPVRFGGEQTVPRDNKSPRQPELVPEAPKPALTGGLFGTKKDGEKPEGAVTLMTGDELMPEHPLDEFVPPATPPAPVAPAADADKATKAEESAILPRFWTVVGPLFEVVGLKDEARLAFIHKALCVEHLNAYQPAKVNGKEAITNAAIHDVMAALRAIYPDAFTADSSGALAVKSAAPTVSALEAAPAVASGAVEIIAKQEDKPVTPTPTLTEASVIIFAKSDVYLTLPDGNVLALSITLREGANLDEVKRLLDMYKQIVALPGVSAAHPVSRPQPAPAVVPPAPQPAAPAQPPAAPTQTAPANGNGERISKVVSGVKVAFDEKG